MATSFLLLQYSFLANSVYYVGNGNKFMPVLYLISKRVDEVLNETAEPEVHLFRPTARKLQEIDFPLPQYNLTMEESIRQLKLELMQRGPVVCCFRMTEDFQHYSSGTKSFQKIPTNSN